MVIHSTYRLLKTKLKIVLFIIISEVKMENSSRGGLYTAKIVKDRSQVPKVELIKS